MTDLRSATHLNERIQDVAQERHGYSIVDGQGKLCRRVDNKLTKVENDASRAYAKIVEGNVGPTEWPETKSWVALFLATMLWRVPEQRRRTSEIHQKLRATFDKYPKSSSGRPLVSYVPVGSLLLPIDTTDYHTWNSATEQELFAEKIEVLSWPTAERLFEKRWIVGCVDQPLCFTGDTPLIKVDEQGDECGIDSPGAMILFPLSPSRVLFMTDRRDAERDAYYPISLEQATACNVVVRANSPSCLFSSRKLRADEIAD